MDVEPLRKTPKHLAIIIDGSGRWAEGRGSPRLAGYLAGMENIHRTVKACLEYGIGILTLYAPPAKEWWHPQVEQAFDRELQEL
ncbi:MAG: undecaprenyl diphosphate synthase family protein, partial [Chloroflexota bacterium]|nr:undecaprenyl diphosphate synthase family protein [Chloroflexota bacterium]